MRIAPLRTRCKEIAKPKSKVLKADSAIAVMVEIGKDDIGILVSDVKGMAQLTEVCEVDVPGPFGVTSAKELLQPQVTHLY